MTSHHPQNQQTILPLLLGFSLGVVTTIATGSLTIKYLELKILQRHTTFLQSIVERFSKMGFINIA
jgi:hypothetical protein